jgi:hypothetical protein
MSNAAARRVGDPCELPPELPLRRDLWPAVAAAIAATPQLPPLERPRSLRWVPPLALAATVASLAIGLWAGRPAAEGPAAETAPFAVDARLGAARQALRVQADVGLATLPAEDRRKVEASLMAIRVAIEDIQRALGEDPANRLLQELLVDSYQDEFRVLNAVKDAGRAGQET